jgi:pyruvate dehydrogenase E2 component (dihydrolipoamide acetyltransferase)
MPIEIVVPRLGWNMDEGIFAGWLLADGARVRAGEPLFRLEAEKATEDVEATDAGTLRIAPTGPSIGDALAVGTVIGYLLDAGEELPAAATPEPRRLPAGNRESPAIPAEPFSIPTATASRDAPRARSSPLARRLARELGIDWTRLQGTGRTGRVRKADVLEAAAARQSLAARLPSPLAEGAGPDSAPERAPASTGLPGARRRVIAARLAAGRESTVPVTITTTIDATNLVNLRAQFRAAGVATPPSYSDIVVKLAAVALREHPALNARLEADRVVASRTVHVSIAVDTDDGLLVPVIRDADTLGLTAIAARSRELIARARGGSLSASEMQGGTFTISNLGTHGVEAFTPVINPPQCAILGMGRIERQPVVHGDQIVGRDRMVLSLTFDHRIVDGAPAARFLQRLGQLIENPAPWLTS